MAGSVGGPLRPAIETIAGNLTGSLVSASVLFLPFLGGLDSPTTFLSVHCRNAPAGRTAECSLRDGSTTADYWSLPRDLDRRAAPHRCLCGLIPRLIELLDDNEQLDIICHLMKQHRRTAGGRD